MSQTSGRHARKRLATVPERERKMMNHLIVFFLFFFLLRLRHKSGPVYCPINRHTQRVEGVGGILYKPLEGMLSIFPLTSRQMKEGNIAKIQSFNKDAAPPLFLFFFWKDEIKFQIISTVTELLRRQLARINLLSWHAAQLVFTYRRITLNTHTHSALLFTSRWPYSILILPSSMVRQRLYKLLWLPFLKLFEKKKKG